MEAQFDVPDPCKLVPGLGRAFSKLEALLLINKVGDGSAMNFLLDPWLGQPPIWLRVGDRLRQDLAIDLTCIVGSFITNRRWVLSPPPRWRCMICGRKSWPPRSVMEAMLSCGHQMWKDSVSSRLGTPFVLVTPLSHGQV